MPTQTAITNALLDHLARAPVRVLRWGPAIGLGLLAALADALAPDPAPGVAHAVINFWVQLVVMIVAAIVAYALAPKPAEPPKPSLEDLSLPTAEEGRPIPVVFGTVWISGPNVLWYGDLRTTAIKSSGGKK